MSKLKLKHCCRGCVVHLCFYSLSVKGNTRLHKNISIDEVVAQGKYYLAKKVSKFNRMNYPLPALSKP